jgi:dolichol-phosphate mannosyltransferase
MSDFAASFFWKHNVVRFLAPFDHVEPVWFYLPGLLLGMLPWTLLLPGMARFLGKRSARSAARRPAALGFFLLAGLGELLFFSAAGCKRPAYVLPVLPPLALALGCYLNVLLPRSPGLHPLAAWLHPASGLAYRASLFVLAAGMGVTLLAVSKQMVKPASGLALAGAALAGMAVLLRGRPAVPWAVSMVATFAVLLAGTLELLPAYNRLYALRGRLRAQIERAASSHLPIVCYPLRWDSVSFYVPNADVRVFTADQRAQLLNDLRSRPDTLLLVKSGKVLEDLLGELPASMEFVTRGRQGAVTVGWVRVRGEPDGPALARR